jgi:hypothetical protein
LRVVRSGDSSDDDLGLAEREAHLMKHQIASSLVVAAGLAIAVAPALASKGGNGGGGGTNSASAPKISLVGSTAYETYATFSTIYPNSVKNPRIQVMCYQNGSLVYAEAGAPDHAFLLGGASSQWVANGGGSASCHADLVDLVWNGNNPQQVTIVASTDFVAAG